MRAVKQKQAIRLVLAVFAMAGILGAWPAAAAPVRGKPKKVVDQKALAAVTAEFHKLEKNLGTRRSGFMTGMRKANLDPQDSVRLDQRFRAATTDARTLAEKWVRINERGGRTGMRPPGWEGKVTRMHDQWLRQAMAAGENPRAGKKAHLASLKLMQAVVARTDDESVIAGYRPRLARLHQLAEQHADAVRAWLELAEPSRTADQGTRVRYLNGAATSQAVIAAWPLTPPWNEVASGKRKGAAAPSQRKELKEILARLAQEQGGVDNVKNWTYDANIGLIDWVAGQHREAIELWKPRLASQAALGGTAAAHRSQAGGFTLRHYRETKSWVDLEGAARQAMSLGWRPAFGTRKIDPVEMLGDALFEGGKSLLASGDAAGAEAKLAEFTANFKRDKRFEEALFLRAKAERGAGHFVESLATLKDFVARFPGSRFGEEATRTGFELSTDMAEEESGLYFGKRYMMSWGKGERARPVIEGYAQLALGNGFYSDGVNALQKIASSTKGQSARTEAMARILDVQTLVGSPESILDTASRLMKMGGLSPDVLLRVYRAQARAAATSGKPGMIQRAKQDASRVMTSIGETDQPARDAMGEILFIDAETRGHKELTDVFSLEVRDPHAHLVNSQTEYARIKGGYDAVCAIGRNIWCAAALFRTGRVAEKFAAAVDGLTIAETLDAETVERFKAKKAELTAMWKKDLETSDSQAAELAGQGMAAPAYALAIQLGGGADLILDDRTIGGLHAFTQIDAR